MRRFVEEALRLESPSQGFFRFAEDAEVAGVRIPNGAMVHVRFAAANRDPEQFPDPDSLDLRRPNAGAHMAFSQGEHHCVGAPLARLELQTAFARCSNASRPSSSRPRTPRASPGPRAAHPALASRTLSRVRSSPRTR